MGAEPITDVYDTVLACGAVNDLDDWCDWDGVVTVTFRGRAGQWTCPKCGHQHDVVNGWDE